MYAVGKRSYKWHYRSGDTLEPGNGEGGGVLWIERDVPIFHGKVCSFLHCCFWTNECKFLECLLRNRLDLICSLMGSFRNFLIATWNQSRWYGIRARSISLDVQCVNLWNLKVTLINSILCKLIKRIRNCFLYTWSMFVFNKKFRVLSVHL